MIRLVALHGFLGHVDDWRRFRDVIYGLAPQIEFQAVDVFSYLQGKLSSRSMKEWAKKFNQTQKSSHVERNLLLGYSLGGRLALQAAMDKPGLWDEVILVSSHPGLMNPDEKINRFKSDLDWAEKFTQLPWEEVVRLWNGQSVFIGSEEPQRAEANYNRSSLAHMLVNWSLAKQDFAGEALTNLRPKLHWYVGEKDVKYVELFQRMKSDGFLDEFHTISEASHRVIFDQPEELARQLVRSLKL